MIKLNNFIQHFEDLSRNCVEDVYRQNNLQETCTNTLEEIEKLVYEKTAKLIPTLDSNQKCIILNICKVINEYPNLILDEFHKWITVSPAIIRIYKFNMSCFRQEYLHMNPKKKKKNWSFLLKISYNNCLICLL